MARWLDDVEIDTRKRRRKIYFVRAWWSTMVRIVVEVRMRIKHNYPNCH